MKKSTVCFVKFLLLSLLNSYNLAPEDEGIHGQPESESSAIPNS